MTYPAMPGVPPVQQPQQAQQQPQGQQSPVGMAPPAVPPQQPQAQQPQGHWGTPQPQQQSDPSSFGQPAQGHFQPQATVPAGHAPQTLQQQQAMQAHQQVVTAAPGVPPEWVGKTMQQVIALYGNIKQELIQRVQQPQQPSAQQPQAQPAASDPAKQANLQFWSDPVGTLNKLISEQIQAAQAPQMALTIAQQMEQSVPGFKQLRPAIEAQMAALPPGAQRDPQAWQLAYKLAVADAALQGRPVPTQTQQPAQQGQQQFVTPPPMQQQNGPGPQHMQTSQPWQSAFTEQPTNGFEMPSPLQISAEEADVASKMGLTPEQWAQGRKITYGR